MAFGILECVPDAMVVVDARGRIVYVNRQALSLFGYEQAELAGQSIEQLLPERLRTLHVGHRLEYSRSPYVRPLGSARPMLASRRDGSEFPVEITLGPADDGHGLYVAATIRDISERVGRESALRDARDTAERASLGKSFFMSAASHDLRQPLQTIALLNGALRRMVRKTEVREVLDEQDKAVNSMATLLGSLLEISRLEAGENNPRRSVFELEPLLEEIRTAFGKDAEQKGLRLAVVADSCSVYSDRNLVGLILRNLADRAITHTLQGRVELRAAAAGESSRIEVSDTGPPLSAGAESLLATGAPASGVGRSAPREGSSLGLMIARHAADLLGAALHVRAAPGGGTTIGLELPSLARTGPLPAPHAQASEPRTESGRPFVVLLVEDDPAVRNATRLYLQRAGFEVLCASTFDEAMQHARGGKPIDLVVSDYHLDTGRTGAEVVAEARSRLGPALRAIIVTGEDLPQLADDINDHRLQVSSKPLRAEELLRLVHGLLQA